jgi:flagellar motor switch protein FliN/FliY
MVETQTAAAGKPASKQPTEKPAESAKASPASRLIEHVEVDVEVLLGEARLTVAELGKLATGDVLPVDRLIAEAADIRVNGRVIARGEIVTVGDSFAVRVTEIGA